MIRKKKIGGHVLFWIKSNKGTDEKAVFKIPDSWSKEDIRFALEKWCFGFSAWTHEENTIHYGCKSINVPGKKELKKKYELACGSKTKIIEKWKILAAMFNIKKLE